MLPQSSSCSYIVFYNQMKFKNYVIIFKQNKENNNTMLLYYTKKSVSFEKWLSLVIFIMSTVDPSKSCQSSKNR